MRTDVLIVGSGCSGLYHALNLPETYKITIITKSDTESCDSYLAQGGICVLKDKDDYDSFFEDTLKAGHFENDRESVSIMINSSRDTIADLVSYGVDFQRDENGDFAYTKEGAHSKNRILFHEDITGKEITSKLLAQVRKRDNIEILENTTLLDIIEKDNECYGAVIKMSDGTITKVFCDYTILATGGIGGIFKYSTNFRHLTGDALAISIKHGVELENIDYIQIHPTTLYIHHQKGRNFLISESVRGEGAKLYDKNMNRFVNELLPRDLLTEKIREQMKKDGTEFVWEDLRPIPKEELLKHFPNIVEHCKEMGFDVFNECIPVIPAQHYFMGGIKVNHNSKTSMERLFAIGETACNGVHGKNRLASNSLLESLVFAKRAAVDITGNYKKATKDDELFDKVDLKKYEDTEKLEEEYKELVLEEIEKTKERREIKNV